MENKVFIDSSIFVALLNKNDSLHKKAIEAIKNIKESGLEPITSNFVLNEVITVLSLRVSKKIALFFANFIYLRDSILDVIKVDEKIENKAVDYLKNTKSKNISFCDCATLAILDLFQIKNIATFDKDFKIKNANFKIVN